MQAHLAIRVKGTRHLSRSTPRSADTHVDNHRHGPRTCKYTHVKQVPRESNEFTRLHTDSRHFKWCTHIPAQDRSIHNDRKKKKKIRPAGHSDTVLQPRVVHTDLGLSRGVALPLYREGVER